MIPIDLTWMDRALDLAERGRYSVSPNPMVGAVLVARGRLVAQGFHRRAGGPHAEAAALSAAGQRARGADLYVTLAPCAHFGATPPCVDAILAAGVARVIIGARDPNRLAQRGGLGRLARGGVQILWADASRRRRAEEQNQKFRVWIAEGRPFVLAKWASTLDGRTATQAGESRWITGAASRHRALLLREEHDGVLVGAGTVAADDPRLTRRLGRNRAAPHWRIVLDGRLRVPMEARLFKKPQGCLVATAQRLTHPHARGLRARGVEVWSLPSGRSGEVDLSALLARLAQRGVTSLMVEGGARTLAGFFEAGVVDRVAAFLSPCILGGERAIGAVGGRGFELARAPRLQDVRIEAVGQDWLVTGRVERGRRTPDEGRRTGALPPRSHHLRAPKHRR